MNPVLENESKAWDKNSNQSSGKYIYSICIYWSSAVFPALSLGPECSVSKTSKGGIINSYLEWQLHNHDCPRQVGYMITLITGNLYCKEEGCPEITLWVQSRLPGRLIVWAKRVSCTYMKHLRISHKLSSFRIDDFLLLALGTRTSRSSGVGQVGFLTTVVAGFLNPDFSDIKQTAYFPTGDCFHTLITRSGTNREDEVSLWHTYVHCWPSSAQIPGCSPRRMRKSQAFISVVT